MQTIDLLNAVLSDLADLKAFNITPLDVRHITPITDFIVVASGNSSKHVRSIAEHLIHKMKERQVCPFGIEGDTNDEWVLVDLGDIVVHIMQPQTRNFYMLEKLWAPDQKNVACA